MTGGVPYTRLVVADVGRWWSAAAAWRALADTGGVRAAELAAEAARLPRVWSGAAAGAAVERLRAIGRLVDVARVAWWEADQAVAVFAAELARARRLLDDAVGAARRSGLTVRPTGEVIGPGSAGRVAGAAAGSVVGADAGPVVGPAPGPAVAAAVGQAVAAIDAALTVAAQADAAAAARLAELAGGLARRGPAPAVTPPCDATPAEVRAWWAALTPEQRRWLVATQPVAVGGLDGVPAAARDAANRLLLDRARAGATGERAAALAALADRLSGEPRAYLLGLGASGDGRAVVAVGDPDRADHVLTHVPGMTADLPGLGPELDRAERVAARAGELAPAARTAAVLWLGYDAPDFVDEAASARQAVAGADGLRRFQEGLRAAHEGPPAHHTLLGHSYGSLVVGMAARTGPVADDVVLVGSPGAGAGSAAQLHGQVWATSSRTDVVQYAAVSPLSLPADLALAARLPVAGPALAFLRPEEDLWHGRNPASEAFGARVFASQASAGHVGYWAADGPALENLARITIGDAAGVTRR